MPRSDCGSPLKILNMLARYAEAHLIEAGCDEAGRGCLAGPVVAAAVILPPHFKHELLNDSKKMNPSDRELARKIIEEQALAWAVAFVDPAEIDQINILQASIQGMHRALDQLPIRPQVVLVDGNAFKPYPGAVHHCMIKGDGRFLSIAAASILAKTHRDAYMHGKHLEYPHYGWDRNKGYPTVQHRRAIEQFGACELHRMSFALLPRQLKLSLE